jgi:hypothetical protein
MFFTICKSTTLALPGGSILLYIHVKFERFDHIAVIEHPEEID